MKRRILSGIALPLLATLLQAQPTAPSGYQVTLHASGIAATGESMAADRFGSVYIVDRPSLIISSVTRVRPGGTVDPAYVPYAGNPTQLAQNPKDGLVYFVRVNPILPVIASEIIRIDPVNGPVSAGSLPVLTDRGFAIDNQGIMFVGIQFGPSGPGIYSHDPNGPTGNLTFRTPGFMNNRHLLALVNGDLLIAEGLQVQRWTPAAIVPVPCYQYPFPGPNGGGAIVGLARSGLNRLGQGALIGVNTFGTFCICRQGSAVFTDVQCAGSSTFATENTAGLSVTGLRALADGNLRDVYWLTENNNLGPAAPSLLYRIREQGVVGGQGSLLVTNPPFALNFALFGNANGFEPFTLGAKIVSTVSGPDGIWVPCYGRAELNPFNPQYIPIIDGLGLTQPANPFGITNGSGAFQLTLTLPPGLHATLQVQDIVVSTSAPNTLYFVSNLETITF